MNDMRTVAHLIQLDMQEMFLSWGRDQPLRTGAPHASALLADESEWCVRRYVLAQLYPDKVVPEKMAYWEWKRQNTFLHGWEIHRKWQRLFKHYGSVVMTNGEYELDLTHYDETRNIFFSPDAILEFFGQQYVVEIKGINHDAYQSLTDSLTVAMRVNETVHKAVVQANLYCHLLDLKRAIILVENKNNQDFKVWITEYDKSLANPYTDRAYAVKGHVSLARNGKPLPARVCQSLEDSRAKKCPLRDVCFRDMEG